MDRKTATVSQILVAAGFKKEAGDLIHAVKAKVVGTMPRYDLPRNEVFSTPVAM